MLLPLALLTLIIGLACIEANTRFKAAHDARGDVADGDCWPVEFAPFHASLIAPEEPRNHG